MTSGDRESPKFPAFLWVYSYNNHYFCPISLRIVARLLGAVSATLFGFYLPLHPFQDINFPDFGSNALYSLAVRARARVSCLRENTKLTKTSIRFAIHFLIQSIHSKTTSEKTRKPCVYQTLCSLALRPIAFGLSIATELRRPVHCRASKMMQPTCW